MDYKLKEIIQFDDINYIKGDVVTIEIEDRYLELPETRGTKLKKINNGKITYIDTDSLEVDCSTEFNACILNIKYKWIKSIKKDNPIRVRVPKGFFEGYKPQEYFKTGVSHCDDCSINIKNGGSGMCNCVLALPKME